METQIHYDNIANTLITLFDKQYSAIEYMFLYSTLSKEDLVVFNIIKTEFKNRKVSIISEVD